MLVKEIMTKNPDALSETMTIREAASEMKKFDFGFLPIKSDGHIVGVVTDRDIVIRAIADGLDQSNTQLKDIMTKDIFYCHEDDELQKIAEIMKSKQIHRLAVYNQQEQLSGVVSIGDIARKCHNTQLCGKLTESIHSK